MRERPQVWHDLVRATGKQDQDEALYIVVETLLDIRDLLSQKQKRKTLTTETVLTDKESALIDNHFDKHGE